MKWRDPDNKGIKLVNHPEEGPTLRPPRSYEGEEGAQAQRWISTVLLKHLKDGWVKGQRHPVEVQTSLEEDGQLTVSSNSNASNELLRGAFQKPGGLEDIVDDVLGGELTPRELRHAVKLRSRLLGKKADERYAGVASAAKAGFTVPEPVPDELDGLHAEQRLERHLGPERFDRAVTRGTKRPCAVCHARLYANRGELAKRPAGPGPAYTSLAARSGVTSADMQEMSRTATHLTIPRDGGKPTDRYDTESDSDPEAAESAATTDEEEHAAASSSRAKGKSMADPAGDGAAESAWTLAEPTDERKRERAERRRRSGRGKRSQDGPSHK